MFGNWGITKEERSIKHRKNLSKALRGRVLTEEWKEKIRQSRIGISHITEEGMKKLSKINSGENHPQYGKCKSKETKKKISKSLKERYKEDGHPSVGRKFSIEERIKHSEIQKTKIGSKSPNWKGGISKEEYGFDFTIELKENIRKRDSYTCQKCGRRPYNIRDRFACHHIDYNKRNNLEKNLITLCISCHARTNGNRIYWKKYFRKLMKKKGYIYNFC